MVFYNETRRNSPDFCVRTCRWAGLAFAGLAEGSLCYCDRAMPAFALPSTRCGVYQCPGDASETCGGDVAIDVFATGAVEVPHQTLEEAPLITPLEHFAALSNEEFENVRIVYVLILTGRSWRQVQRMFRLLYHTSNYFYIHVDLKSEYLYSKCRTLASLFPDNVYVTPNRQNPVWGAPSLLDVLLSIMDDLFDKFSHWKWDFFINLSETDLPVVPVGTLVRILNNHRGRIFAKQTGEETFKYIHSEGLQYAFVQCRDYVWRVGLRPPLDGVVIHGGSDWLILPRNFCYYSVRGSDDLVSGLRKWFQNAILPVESFFHTLAHNSHFCDSVVNTNLRLTNWQRPRGCSCKKNSVADWCGCSPSVFSGPQGLGRLSEMGNQSGFARKFDSTIDVAMVNYVERRLLGREFPDDESSDTYLESIFASRYDTGQISHNARTAIKVLLSETLQFATTSATPCQLNYSFSEEENLREVDVFAFFNTTKLIGISNYTRLGAQLDRSGFLPSKLLNSLLPLRLLATPDLVLRLPALEVLFHRDAAQAWMSPRSPLSLRPSELLYFEVSSGFDVKELVFRDYYRFMSAMDRLTLVVIWRNSEQAVPLTARLFAPGSAAPSCSLNVSRGSANSVPYPGLPGFRASFVDFDLRVCSQDAPRGLWRVEIDAKVATFSVDEVGLYRRHWKAVDACGSCLQRECRHQVWSPARLDRKSALGRFDASTGFLLLGNTDTDILDIAI
ncbi:unnamed protein product [Mesocestoides corti]|uniref:protein xylosyltransferase n=1 Tax=Mesocestoides corti TaxID=53468 RepID=A0A3P6HLY0_MESCO|nr:unnamed protein product [Mesocestoides corti]